MAPGSSSKRINTILRGSVICLSLETPEQLHESRETADSLGASVVDDASEESITHLVCDTAGSVKHRTLCRRNARLRPSERPMVVTRDWLTACKMACLRVATDPYILQPLSGMVLCCSGLQQDEKVHIEKLAQDLGAVYNKTLGTLCTHLICTTAIGKKYQFALDRPSISILRPKWIHECARLNLLIDEFPFQLTTRHSTRADAAGADPNGDVDSHMPTSVVNPTIADSVSRPAFHTKKFPFDAPSSSHIVVPPTTANAVDDSLPSSQLDALCVYLTQSPLRDNDKHAPLRAKALRLLALSGATAMPDVQPFPTVIVVLRLPVAPSTTAPIREAVEAGVPITSLQWLEDCVAKDTILSFDAYPAPQWRRVNGGDAGASSDMAGLSQSQSQAVVSLIFQGCRVSLGALWLRDERAAGEVERQLVSGRAKVLPYDHDGMVTAGVPTHVVCAPYVQAREREVLHGVMKSNAKASAVTPFWVDSCIATDQLLPAGKCALFTPLRHEMPLRDMAERRVSVTLSGFQRKGEGDWNRRREVLSRLVELLGAKYSERMRRRGTTHVVADRRVSGSDKVQKAREWGIHVVSDDWLLTCAAEGKVVAEETYKVDLDVTGNGAEAEAAEADGDEDEEETEETGEGNRTPKGTKTLGTGARSTTPRRSARLVDGTGRASGTGAGAAGDGRDKEGGADAAAINLFKRLTAGLEQQQGADGLGDSMEEVEVKTGEEGEGEDERYRGRRSRSASRDALGSDREWSLDASQSQVIVHRDLTPPPTPRSKLRNNAVRTTKRARTG